MAPDDRGASRRARRLDEQVSELGSRRSREVGARRLRVRSRRLARRRPLARPARSLVGPRGPGPLPLRRVGRCHAVEQRQGRPQRHLLLRDEPVAGRRTPAAAPGGDLRVGGRGRLLPRPEPPRRHPVRVRPRVVSLAGRPRPAWAGRARLSEPHDRRLGLGPADPDGGRARSHSPGLLGGLPAAPAGERRVLALPHARLVEGDDAALVGGELGRARPAPARQLRGLRALGVAPEVARGARHRALDPLLHGLRRRAAEEVLRPLPQGRGHGVAQAAEGRAPGASSRRALRGARGERVAARAHAVDEALPEPGRPEPRPRSGREERQRALRRARRRGDVPGSTAPQGDRDHRARCGQALRVVPDDGRRSLPDPAGLLPRHAGDHLPGCARSAHADRPGLAPRLPPEARSGPHTALPALSHARRAAAAAAGPGVRAGRRDLAHLDRRAGRPPRGPHRSRPGLRVSRGTERRARHARRRLHGRRPLQARRSARSTAGDLRQDGHAPLRTGPALTRAPPLIPPKQPPARRRRGGDA